MADHDYKQGGWREKYHIFKRCEDCAGTGIVLKQNGIPVHCLTCNGRGFVPTDPNATYFVLRLDEDPHARVAAVAYAQSIQAENPQLAIDIRQKLAETHKQEFEL